MPLLGSVPERLAANHYDVDEEESHIEVDQDAARRTQAGPLLERVCAARVYTSQPDGSVLVQAAACLECGTCLAVAPPGVLRWHYPRGGFGIAFREG
ncbi:ferredoxin family protein [Cellulomonas soli]|uniref:Ferredoxin-like protein n=1 Tax=Cellulomonas soli TaxID=931535 RepID=A0A512PD36_9CELL|nr:4Fe-4S dicluster domain-containing protein [Cellulomonas soli]NYI60227.1 ferredoxin like protein [Cellulomonas soli]GEP69119.1 ferredoxin [Cellulomonas soli]